MTLKDLEKKIKALEKRLCCKTQFYNTFEDFPEKGVSNALYVDETNLMIYTWDGTYYLPISGSGSGYSYETIAYTNNIPFTSNYISMEMYVQTGAIIFSPNTTDAVPGGVTLTRIVANGNPITFTGIKEITTSSEFDTTNGVLNYLVFFYDGVNYFVNIFQEKDAAPIDYVAPIYQSSEVINTDPDIIVLTYNENLDELSIPNVGDFAVSGGRTVTGISINGTEVTLTVDIEYEEGDVITVSYTPGTNKIQDVWGNAAVALINESANNYIGGSEIVFTWGNLNNASNTPPNIVHTAGASGIGIANETWDASDNFYIRTVVPATITDINAAVVMIEDTVDTNSNWNVGNTYLAGFYQYGGNLYSATDGVSNVAHGTISSGDWLRLSKSGSDIIFEVSTNSGVTWSTQRTFTGALVGKTTLYAKVLFATNENQIISVIGKF